MRQLATLIFSACAMGGAPAAATRTVDSTTASGASEPVVASVARVATAPDQTSGIEYYSATLLAHVGDSLSRTTRTGHVLGAHDSFQTIELRRAGNGVPEVHDRWTDVMVFQSGRATILLGGRVTGGALQSPGEHRGGTIAGGSPRPVGPGDLLVIPAGTPHEVQVAKGDSLRYITVKVPAAHR
ncbi:MAG: hypothetical protein JWM41_1792 [Gemmatimonadetes bacterium]|nr:hypothetical protein [Gemmatimonadota bacterium]